MDNLLSLFPVSTLSGIQTIRLGVWEQPGVPFRESGPELSGKMRGLVQALIAYDRQNSKDNARVVQRLIAELGMHAVKLREDPRSLYIYAPAGSEVAIVAGAGILWRPGKVRIAGRHETYENPWYNTLLSNEHVKKDFADRCAIQMWLHGACKVMLVNSRMPGPTPPPPGQESTCQPARNGADVAHSNNTGYARVFHELVRVQFPQMAVINIHRYSPKSPSAGPILLNNFNSQFLDTGAKSWPLLLMLSAAHFDFPIASLNFATSMDDFFVVINGTRMPLINEERTGYFVSRSGVQNSNVPGHIRNGGSCVLGRVQLDMSMHIEFTKAYNESGSPLMAQFVQMFNLAQEFYLKYNPELHNPYAVPDRVRMNMRLYRDYFNSQLAAEARIASSSTVPAMRMAASSAAAATLSADGSELLAATAGAPILHRASLLQRGLSAAKVAARKAESMRDMDEFSVFESSDDNDSDAGTPTPAAGAAAAPAATTSSSSSSAGAGSSIRVNKRLRRA